MSETKTKNLCTVPAADLNDSQYFIAEDGGELKRIPKAQVVLKKLEKMLATDTENLAGGGEVTAQELLDALAEQVANKLLAKSQVVNNLLATVEGNPLDATQGKALKELIDTTNNNLSNKSGFRKVIIDDTSATDREDLLKKKAKLIYDNQLGDGFYALVGGWAGKGYGFGIAEITAGKIMFLYMLMDTTYKCICDNLSTQSNFVYNQEGIIKAADFFKWNEVEISLPSLAANNGEVYEAVYTIPESYFENGKWTTAAMCGFSLSGTRYTSCTITMCKIIGNSIQYSVRNMGSAALSDIKLKVFIMFARI